LESTDRPCHKTLISGNPCLHEAGVFVTGFLSKTWPHLPKRDTQALSQTWFVVNYCCYFTWASKTPSSELWFSHVCR
jgi:hypothetical protein